MNSTFNFYIKGLQFLGKNVLKYAQINSFSSTFMKTVNKINIKLSEETVDFPEINYDHATHLIQNSILSANVTKSINDMFIH